MTVLLTATLTLTNSIPLYMLSLPDFSSFLFLLPKNYTNKNILIYYNGDDRPVGKSQKLSVTCAAALPAEAWYTKSDCFEECWRLNSSVSGRTCRKIPCKESRGQKEERFAQHSYYLRRQRWKSKQRLQLPWISHYIVWNGKKYRSCFTRVIT